jgi:hypothetical protein
MKLKKKKMQSHEPTDEVSNSQKVKLKLKLNF